MSRENDVEAAAVVCPLRPIGYSMRPWRIEGDCIVAADGDVVMTFDIGASLDNAELIVDGVNALQMPGPGYPSMREQLPDGSRIRLVPPEPVEPEGGA